MLEVEPRLVLEAPLEPNLNHRDTAFGGSVAALAILSGWSWVHTRLRNAGREGPVVIHSSEMRWDRPIHGAFRTECEPPTHDAWQRFLRTLERRGRARLKLRVTVEAGGESAGAFEAAYVALEG